jgi:hypothetical protein
MSEPKQLDLGFFEFDVLSNHGIELADQQLFSLGLGVLGRGVEKPSAGRRNQLDVNPRHTVLD